MNPNEINNLVLKKPYNIDWPNNLLSIWAYEHVLSVKLKLEKCNSVNSS